jgi:hypothetical protein
VADHVLLEKATKLPEAASELRDRISEAIIEDIISKIPDHWLLDEPSSLTPTEKRDAYFKILNERLSNLDLLTKEAVHAR